MQEEPEFEDEEGFIAPVAGAIPNGAATVTFGGFDMADVEPFGNDLEVSLVASLQGEPLI